MLETIGFLELNSIAKGVEAADLILKTAEVDLIFAKAGCPGLVSRSRRMFSAFPPEEKIFLKFSRKKREKYTEKNPPGILQKAPFSDTII